MMLLQLMHWREMVLIGRIERTQVYSDKYRTLTYFKLILK